MYGAMAPTPKSLILDLLSTLAGGTMPVRALVAGRRAVRDRREQRAGRAGAPRWPGARSSATSAGATGSAPSPRRSTASSPPGAASASACAPGTTTGSACTPPASRRARRSVRCAAASARSASSASASWRRASRSAPTTCAAASPRLRTELQALGLEAGALVFELRALDPASDARARGLWDVAALCAGYRQSLADLEASEQHLQIVSEAEGMVESFLLGGRVIRQLVLDPLLPEPIVPVGERDALVRGAAPLRPPRARLLGRVPRAPRSPRRAHARRHAPRRRREPPRGPLTRSRP